MSTFYDKLRKKEIIETPEEKVRQFFMSYLLQVLEYPRSLLRIEKKIIKTVKKRQLRPDIVVYNNLYKPFIVVECKAENVAITDDTIIQVMNYNKYLNARYVVVTNKKHTFCWEKNEDKYVPSEIPKFTTLD